MKNLALTALACALLGLTTETASAQSAVLSEMYGRGVHAYYAGNYDDAHQYLSMAIDNDIQDPRAYYFRGIVAHNSGRPEEAEFDWRTGAEMEASGKANPAIGRSLARFQGTARLKLESLRQTAKLKALAAAMARSKERYGEIDAATAAAAPPTPKIMPPTGAKSLIPPGALPPTGADPFADDMAQGQPKVVADDAFAGAMDDPFAGEATTPAAGGTPAGGDPFGGGAGAGADPFGGGGAGGADPFGGGAGAGADPFGGAGGGDPSGGGAAGGADDDPFGGGGAAGGADDDPFGGGGAGGGGEDPFGGNPFGN